MGGEADFINALKAIARHPAARGLCDDAAVLDVDGAMPLVLTHDMIAQGVHFLPETAARDVAWKLVSVNMSDLAAKGAQPIGVLLGYCLGDAAWDAAFLAGLDEALAFYGVALLGGDTIALPNGSARTFSLTAIGRASCVPVPDRSGAKAGDSLYLAGPIGDAMLGFQIASGAKSMTNDVLLDAYVRPRAQVIEGRVLAPDVHAMMDVSDGLLIDAGRMAQASGLSVDITTSAIPFSPAFYAAKGDRDAAMRWGDDYCLLFAAPSGLKSSVSVKEIGRFQEFDGTNVRLDGVALPADSVLGYQH